VSLPVEIADDPADEGEHEHAQAKDQETGHIATWLPWVFFLMLPRYSFPR
jgi:hypothetical protein